MDFGSVIIYSSYACVSVLTAYIGVRNKNKFFILLSYLICVLFWGLRKDIGFDYDGYVIIFKDIQSDKSSYVELGYFWLNKVFSIFKNGYIAVIFFSSAITFGFLYLALLKYKILWQGLLYSLVFQFQFMAANQLRQAMAIAIFLSFVYFLKEKKYIKYSICVILTALLVHTSAVFLIIGIPLSWINLNKYYSCSLIVAAYIAYLLGVWASTGYILFSLLPIPEAYLHFLMSDRIFGENIGFSLVQLFNIGMGLYIIWNKASLPNYISSLYLIGLLCYIIFVEYHLFLRISFYFSYLNIIGIAIICKRYPKKTQIITAISCFFFFLICCQSTNMHGIIPYKSIL